MLCAELGTEMLNAEIGLETLKSELHTKALCAADCLIQFGIYGPGPNEASFKWHRI